jgi:hypothetical protein
MNSELDGVRGEVGNDLPNRPFRSRRDDLVRRDDAAKL